MPSIVISYIELNFVSLFVLLHVFRWESSNPVHGRTRNPYDTNRIVGGSSGGEGCLLVS